MGPANWNYLCRLFQELQNSQSSRAKRNIILQEVSNVCRLEYQRVQMLFKRHVQAGSGSKYFERISGVFDAGNPKVITKVEPEALTRNCPRLHYTLRLCQTETDAYAAID
jgi:hypothetical protein